VVDPSVVRKHPKYAYDGPIEAIRIYSTHGDADMKMLRDRLLKDVRNQGARDRIHFYLSDKYIVPAIEKRKTLESRPVTDRDRQKLRGEFQQMKAGAAGHTPPPAKEGLKEESVESFPAPQGSLSATVADDVRQIVKEGLNAFEQFLKELESERYDVLQRNILDNAIPVYPVKGATRWAAFLKHLQVQRALMAEVQSAGLLENGSYRHFRITVSLTATIEELAAIAKNSKSMQGTEEVTLLFVIPKSADIYKKHIPRIGGSSAQKTITPEDDLQVYMKRINGKWYWNPFGW